jgi:hypothetical protein
LANISIEDIALRCHPATPPFMADNIQVAMTRQGSGALWLRYHIDCDLNSLEIPDTLAPMRTDELWKTTCCELFVRRETGDAYLEYNFSPSSQWAAYHFGGYRSGMTELMTYRPQIYGDASETHFALEAELQLPDEWREGPLWIGLTAVIAETGDTTSYWALTHPDGKPDFHHRDCFALYLEAPSAA